MESTAEKASARAIADFVKAMTEAQSSTAGVSSNRVWMCQVSEASG